MQNLTIISALFLIVSFVSCEKDKSSDRDAFLGTYSVHEACSQNYDYSITITPSGDNSETILISNFGGINQTVKAKVQGNSISIEPALLNVGGTTVNISNGSGAINGNILTISYTYSIGTVSENCVMTCTKQ